MIIPTEHFSYPSSDGVSTVAAYRVVPERPRAMLQIVHGMCEHFGRYEAFAQFFAAEGILVFGNDLLGHGHTAKSEADLGFTAHGDGVEPLEADVCRLTALMKEEYPDLPVILFGHSMGSFLVRKILAGHGGDYSAAILSGTGGNAPSGIGKFVTSLMMLFLGERHRSPMVKNIAFAGYLKGFGKGCDPFAWLTRDEESVKSYNADPLCGFLFTLRGYHDLFSLISAVSSDKWARALPKNLPVLLVSGEEDPVGGKGKGVLQVVSRMTRAGMTDVTCRLYPGMRHEVFNEIGNGQVREETLAWINALRNWKN